MILQGEDLNSNGLNHSYSRRKTKRINFDSFYEDDSLSDLSQKQRRNSRFSTMESMNVQKIFLCEKCEKKYLSYSALYSHKRSKHRNQNYQKKKKTYYPKIKYLEKCRELFTQDESKSGSNNAVQSFEEFFEKERNGLFREISQINEFELYRILKQGDYLNDTDPEETSCDFIFCKYLSEVSSLTNKHYFIDCVLKFIISLRSCINKYGPEYKEVLFQYGFVEEVKINEEYSKVYNAEELPEVTNIYFETLDENLYEGTNFSEFDFVELMLNFNSWLFYSDYTPYRICLINN